MYRTSFLVRKQHVTIVNRCLSNARQSNSKIKFRSQSTTTSSPLNKSIFSLLTYFKLEDQGMTDFEILSRSSCTLFQAPKVGLSKNKFYFLGPKHVTHPWLFKHFYGQDWLSFLDSSNVKAFIGIHNEDGTLLDRFETQNNGVCDEELDLVHLVLNDEQEFEKSLSNLSSHSLKSNSFSISNLNEKKLQCDGYTLVEDNQIMKPTNVTAQLNRNIDDGRLLLKTSEVLKQGMCGGAVTFVDDNNETQLVGLVEAIVENVRGELEHADVVGSAVILPSSKLCDFEEYVYSFHSF